MTVAIVNLFHLSTYTSSSDYAELNTDEYSIQVRHTIRIVTATLKVGYR